MSQIITKIEDIADCKDNSIILADEGSFAMKGGEIRFSGKNNILFCEKGVTLENCRINFNADNSVVYISESWHPYKLDIMVNNNCVCYLGRNGYYNGALHIICSEERSVFIGDGLLMSFGVWIRTADPHLVYSIDTKTRINPSKSVFIGDHVWIGQNALILKGSRIHSGSILGGGAVLAGRKVPSNCSYAGNPAKEVARNIFWTNPCVHKWTEEDTAKNEKCGKSGPYVFAENKSTVSFDQIEERVRSAADAEGRLAVLAELAQNKDHNRFAMGGAAVNSEGIGTSLKKKMRSIIK